MAESRPDEMVGGLPKEPDLCLGLSNDKSEIRLERRTRLARPRATAIPQLKPNFDLLLFPHRPRIVARISDFQSCSISERAANRPAMEPSVASLYEELERKKRVYAAALDEVSRLSADMPHTRFFLQMHMCHLGSVRCADST